MGVLEEAGRAALPEPLAETAALAAPLLVGAAPAEAPGLGEREPTPLGAWPWGARGHRRRSGSAPPAPGRHHQPAGGIRRDRRDPPGGGAGRAGLFLLALTRPARELTRCPPSRRRRHQHTPAVDPTVDLASVRRSRRARPSSPVAAEARDLVGDLADRAALATAAQLLGLAETMITLAAEYAKERRSSSAGPSAASRPSSTSWPTPGCSSSSLGPPLYRAAWSLAAAAPSAPTHASMAKALASDAAELAARVALQVHGAIGYTWACDLQLFMKRAWSLAAPGGTPPPTGPGSSPPPCPPPPGRPPTHSRRRPARTRMSDFRQT